MMLKHSSKAKRSSACCRCCVFCIGSFTTTDYENFQETKEGWKKRRPRNIKKKPPNSPYKRELIAFTNLKTSKRKLTAPNETTAKQAN
jgi:hypothetical protein